MHFCLPSNKFSRRALLYLSKDCSSMFLTELLEMGIFQDRICVNHFYYINQQSLMLLLMHGAVYWDYFWLSWFFWCIQSDPGTAKSQYKLHRAIIFFTNTDWIFHYDFPYKYWCFYILPLEIPTKMTGQGGDFWWFGHHFLTRYACIGKEHENVVPITSSFDTPTSTNIFPKIQNLIGK